MKLVCTFVGQLATATVYLDGDHEEYRTTTTREGKDQGEKADSFTDDQCDALRTAATIAGVEFPNFAQVEALLAFKAKHRRLWKEKLNTAWCTGKDCAEPNGALLRQVRNEFGPSWLHAFKLGA